MSETVIYTFKGSPKSRLAVKAFRPPTELTYSAEASRRFGRPMFWGVKAGIGRISFRFYDLRDIQRLISEGGELRITY